MVPRARNGNAEPDSCNALLGRGACGYRVPSATFASSMAPRTDRAAWCSLGRFEKLSRIRTAVNVSDTRGGVVFCSGTSRWESPASAVYAAADRNAQGVTEK